LITWLILSALGYHLVAGIKHLVMDSGIGESLEGGYVGAIITLVGGAIVIALAGVWVW
jgi:succinate dehydrogenase / fumarate reductase cytochrome b subunit